MLLADKAKDISVPPELVKPCIIPTLDNIEILKKLILYFILSFKITKIIEKIITRQTNNLKLMKFSKNFKINKPINIEGIHIIKNFLNSL